MRDFRESKTFRPYRTVAAVPVLRNGQITTELQHYSWCMGYMSQGYKAKLFLTARASLEPGGGDSAEKLSAMANYLTSMGVENFSWMVGSNIQRSAPAVEHAMERLYAYGDEDYDPIHQEDALHYARFGRSMLRLVRIPTAEDALINDVALPISLEVKSDPGPEMLFGFSETTITTIYPLPLNQ